LSYKCIKKITNGFQRSFLICNNAVDSNFTCPYGMCYHYTTHIILIYHYVFYNLSGKMLYTIKSNRCFKLINYVSHWHYKILLC